MAEIWYNGFGTDKRGVKGRKILNFENGYGEKELKEYLSDYFSKADMVQSQAALEYAIVKHRDQVRKEGIPYIIHPMVMAKHALMLGLTEDDLVAVVLLHDVCEDCGVEPEGLPVNENVRQGVYYMTCKKQEGETKAQAKERYYTQMAASREACIVKVLDRCHNVSSMAQAFSPRGMQAYIMETRQYILPILEQNIEKYPETASAMWILEYHLKSVIATIEKLL